MEIINIIITVLSLVAAILAWIAKILWSKEYSQAKDEIIRSKDSQIEELKTHIEHLKDLNPVTVREYFDRTRQDLEEYNSKLKTQVEETKQIVAQKEESIKLLTQKGHEKSREITKLSDELTEIKKNAHELELLLQEIPDKSVFKFDPQWINKTMSGSAVLASSTGQPFVVPSGDTIGLVQAFGADYLTSSLSPYKDPEDAG